MHIQRIIKQLLFKSKPGTILVLVIKLCRAYINEFLHFVRLLLYVSNQKNINNIKFNNLKAFRARKSSEILFILGSGDSISSYTEQMWKHIAQHDSLGFNKWYLHAFVPTFYCLELKNESNIDSSLLSNLEKIQHKYCNTPILLKDVPNITNETAQHLSRFKRIEFVIPFLTQIVGDTEVHFRYCLRLLIYVRNLLSCLNIQIYFQRRASISFFTDLAIQLGYKKIILCGVDLNNTKYFYENPTFENVHRLPIPPNIQPDNRIHETNHPDFGDMTIAKILAALNDEVVQPAGARLYIAQRTSALYPQLEEYPWPD